MIKTPFTVYIIQLSFGQNVLLLLYCIALLCIIAIYLLSSLDRKRRIDFMFFESYCSGAARRKSLGGKYDVTFYDAILIVQMKISCHFYGKFLLNVWYLFQRRDGINR